MQSISGAENAADYVFEHRGAMRISAMFRGDFLHTESCP